MSTTLASPTSAFPIPVQVSFNQPVTGFASNDLVVSNATVGTFTGSGADYTFELVPNQDGAITADIAADSAFNAGGTGNQVAPPVHHHLRFRAGPHRRHRNPRRELAERHRRQRHAVLRPDGGLLRRLAVRPPAKRSPNTSGTTATAVPCSTGSTEPTCTRPPAPTRLRSPSPTNTAGRTWPPSSSMSSPATAMTYYVDAELGNDGNAGTSPEQAWRTAAFAFNGSYQAGDQILFKRGQTLPSPGRRRIEQLLVQHARLQVRHVRRRRQAPHPALGNQLQLPLSQSALLRLRDVRRPALQHDLG